MYKEWKKKRKKRLITRSITNQTENASCNALNNSPSAIDDFRSSKFFVTSPSIRLECSCTPLNLVITRCNSFSTASQASIVLISTGRDTNHGPTTILFYRNVVTQGEETHPKFMIWWRHKNERTHTQQLVLLHKILLYWWWWWRWFALSPFSLGFSNFLNRQSSSRAKQFSYCGTTEKSGAYQKSGAYLKLQQVKRMRCVAAINLHHPNKRTKQEQQHEQFFIACYS